jgi:hypothetical protein
VTYSLKSKLKNDSTSIITLSFVHRVNKEEKNG